MKINLNHIKRSDYLRLSENIEEIAAYNNCNFKPPVCTLYNSIYDKESSRKITPSELSRWIGRGKYKEQVKEIRNAESLEKIKELKQALPVVMFGGESKSRKEIERFSKLIIMDFDHIENPLFYQKQLEKYPYVYMTFKSPNDGLKVVVIADIKTKEEYTTYIHELFDLFDDKLGLSGDRSKQNPNDLCYLSYDPEHYINLWADYYNDYRDSVEKPLYNSDNTLENIEYMVGQIESKRIDITEDYVNWRNIGFALNDYLREEGRDFFHRISIMSDKYEESECDKQYDSILNSSRSGIKVGTFFYIAKMNGLEFLDVTPKIDLSKPFYTGEDLLNYDVKELPYLIESLFPQTGIVALGGSSDTGKSTFLRQLAIDIVTRSNDFIGFPIKAKHNKVIYVSSEDDILSISHLLYKQKQGYHITPSELKNLIYIFETDNLKTKIETILKSVSVDAIIIDAYSDIIKTDFNSLGVRSHLNEYRDLALKYNCLVVFLHHTGKSSEDKAPSKNNLLGSQGFEGKMRLVIELRRDKSDNTLRHMCIVKGNYVKDEEKGSSYLLEFNKNMIFSNTGRRVSFNELNNSNKSSYEDREKLRSEILKLKKEENLSIRKIAERLGIGKTKVGDIVKDLKENGEIEE
jgi:KaiC/GvpD/RAD55 family RecA-like ATPase/predicted XRE-type DNA-binding protein